MRCRKPSVLVDVKFLDSNCNRPWTALEFSDSLSRRGWSRKLDESCVFRKTGGVIVWFDIKTRLFYTCWVGLVPSFFCNARDCKQAKTRKRLQNKNLYFLIHFARKWIKWHKVKTYHATISFFSQLRGLQPEWHWANQWKEFKVCNCRADDCCGQTNLIFSHITKTWRFYLCVPWVNLFLRFECWLSKNMSPAWDLVDVNM